MGIETRKETYKFYLKDNIWKSPKLLRNKDEIINILSGGDSKPIHVTIDTIEVCNQRCIMCFYHGRKSNIMKDSTFNGKGVFPFNRLINLIDELKETGTECISFTGTGETLLYPDIYKIFQRILDNDMEYGITTNLSVDLSSDNIDVLSKASWIRCSLNSATNKHYNEINRPRNKDDDINKVLNNIKSLPNINISYAILNENVSDILNTTKLVKGLGANSIFFRPEMTFDIPIDGKNHNDEVISGLKEAKKMETSSFKVYETYDDANINQDLICYYSNHTAYIDAYGDVYPCCVTKYHKKYIYGNIMNQHFKEFWDSDKRRENYKKINMRFCPPCKHYIDNSMLELLYNDDKIFNRFI